MGVKGDFSVKILLLHYFLLTLLSKLFQMKAVRVWLPVKLGEITAACLKLYVSLLFSNWLVEISVDLFSLLI